MLHIYYGNGKGKTTAAVGLTVRACGAGMKTAFFQFLKNGSSSEIEILRSMNSVQVFCCIECNKFTFEMSDEDKKVVTLCHDRMLQKAANLLDNNDVQLIVLDEFLDAYNKNLINKEISNQFIDNYLQKCEIIMTGRDPSEELKKCADYLTEMKAVKHPYDNGISARKGIEY